MNHQHYLASDSVLHNDKPYHKTCVETQQSTQQSSSSPTFIQKLQQSIRSYNLLSSELTFTTSPTNNTDNPNVQSESSTQPTTNPEQEPSRVLSLQELEQSLNTHRKNNPLISELSSLTPTIEDTTNNTTTTTTDMDIDNSIPSDINQQHQQQHQQQQVQQQQQQQQQPQNNHNNPIVKSQDQSLIHHLNG